MAADFPGALPTSISGTVGPSTTLSNAGHATDLHVKDRDELIALGTKLGIGSASATPGTGVVLVGTGTGISAWQAITSAYVGTGAITSAALASGAVTSAAIASGAVTSAALASGAISSATIGAGSVTSAALASSSVTSAAIASSAVTSAALASGAVGSAALASSAVTSAALASGAVTTAKLAADAVNKIWTVNVDAEQSTTSTSYVDVPGMSVSVTTTGQPVYVLVTGSAYTAGSPGQTMIALKVGTASETWIVDEQSSSATKPNTFALQAWLTSSVITAGSATTIQLRFYKANGTTAYLKNMRMWAWEVKA